MNKYRFHSVLFLIGFLWLLMLRTVYAGLPWDVIAEKYDQGVLLFEKVPNLSEDSVSKDFEINVDNFNYPDDIGEVTVSFQRWSAGKWNPIGQASLGAADGKMPGKNLGDGFYKTQLDPSGDDPNSAKVYYFLLKSDWKKDLLGFCRQARHQIETHPQAHDIRASIALSHYDNLLEDIVASQYLTGKVMGRLSESNRSKRQFLQGQIPDFVKGLSALRFKRFEGAEYAEFVLHIPEGYDGSAKWPLYIHVDPSRWSVGQYGQPDNWNRHIYHDGMLDMWWHTTSHENMRWKDYVFLMETLRQKLNIDENRTYLYGLCGNGIAAMALAVNHPDQWAECLFSTGNSYRHLTGNAVNLSMVYDNAHPGNTEQTAYADFAIKCFQYFGCGHFTHTTDQNTSYRRGAIIPQTIRDLSPHHVLYTIESLANPKSYWLQIDGRDDENFTASIEAVVDGQTLTVTRKNVDAYQLDLRLAPLNHTRPMTIIDNGDRIDIGPQELFVYKSKKYDEATYTKNGQLHGPIADVFTDAYTVFYTTGKDGKQTNQIKNIAKQIAGTGPCLAETKASEEIIQKHHIVIVGRADTSQIFNKLSNALPIQFTGAEIAFDGHSAGGDVGVAMVFPNPLNPEKYIALVLSDSDLVLKNMPNIWNTEIANADVDAAIFKVKPNNQYDLIRFEKFNTVWDWHTHWNETLATVSREHPKWQWRQWFAYVVRCQMESDVMISEEVIEVPTFLKSETLTLRHLNRFLKDQWHVKIKLNGRELKKVLMQSFPRAGGLNKNKTDEPVVDGICFIKSMAGPDCLHVSDIKEEKYYTVAMPYKAVNGSRIGTILKDYEIVGDGYLLPMLYQYLKSRESVDLDTELDEMKLTII